MPLTLAQEAFCQAFVDCLGNVSKAVAVVREQRPSSRITVAKAEEWLDWDAELFVRIQELRLGVAEALQVDRVRLAEELAAIAFYNPADYFDHDGQTLTVRSLSELTDKQLRAIAEITQTDTATGPVIKIKFHDKMAAIDRLNKMQGNYQGENLNVRHTFVLRAPVVAPTTDAWVEANPIKVIEHMKDEV